MMLRILQIARGDGCTRHKYTQRSDSADGNMDGSLQCIWSHQRRAHIRIQQRGDYGDGMKGKLYNTFYKA